jgi:hypothetical protein
MKLIMYKIRYLPIVQKDLQDIYKKGGGITAGIFCLAAALIGFISLGVHIFFLAI